MSMLGRTLLKVTTDFFFLDISVLKVELCLLRGPSQVHDCIVATGPSMVASFFFT